MAVTLHRKGSRRSDQETTMTGEQAKQLRKSMGMSLPRFGRAIEYSPRQIMRWEAGEASVPPDLRQRVAKAALTDVVDLTRVSTTALVAEMGRRAEELEEFRLYKEAMGNDLPRPVGTRMDDIA